MSDADASKAKSLPLFARWLARHRAAVTGIISIVITTIVVGVWVAGDIGGRLTIAAAVATLLSVPIALVAWRYPRATSPAHANNEAASSTNFVPLGIESSAQAVVSDASLAWRGMSIAPPIGRLDTELRGRSNLTNLLKERLAKAWLHPQVLTGLGGCGKTSLALELVKYAMREGHDVWWISAVNRDSINNGMRALAAQLGASQQRVIAAWTSPGDAADLVWGLLNERHNRWLLVVDNADDTTVLSALDEVPAEGRGWIRATQGNGTVVVTSRDANAKRWGAWCDIHSVECLQRRDGALVLRDFLDPVTSEGAGELAVKLGGLPLALNLVGKFLSHTPLWPTPGRPRNCHDYLQWLDRDFGAGIRAGETLQDGEPRRLVTATWELSLDQIAIDNPVSRSILGAFSCLADAPIPFAVLLQPECFNEAKGERASDLDLQTATSRLNDFGLITVEPPRNRNNLAEYVARIHPLLRETIQSNLEASGSLPALLETAARLLHAAAARLDPDQPRHWSIWRGLVPHIHHLTENLLSCGAISQTAIANLLDAQTFRFRFLLATAQTDHAWDEVDLQGTSLKRRLPNTAPAAKRFQAASAYARILDNQYSSGISMLNELGSIKTMRIGKNAEDDRDALLVRYYTTVAKFEAGDRLNKIQELEEIARYQASVCGPGHIDTIRTQYTIVYFQTEVGGRRTTIQDWTKVLSDAEYHLGEDHVMALGARHNIATVHCRNGDFSTAKKCLDKLLADRRRLFGDENSHTLYTQMSIGELLIEEGNLDDAASLLTSTLVKQRRVLRPEHADVLNCRFFLARIQERRGDRDGALSMYRELLTDQKQTLGSAHWDTVRTRDAVHRLTE